MTPASKNLWTFTQELDNGVWTKTLTTIIPNQNPAEATLGSELVTNGDFASGTGWTASAGWVIGSGVATATATSSSLFGGGFTPVIGRVYAVTFTCTITSGTLSVALALGTAASFTTSGTRTIYLQAGSSITRGIEFYGGTVSGTVDNISVREVIGGWNIAPDGSPTADKLVATATTGYHAVSRSPTFTTGLRYSYSFYAKAAEYTKLIFADLNNGSFSCTFDLVAGTASLISGANFSNIVPTITPEGNGWYRCALTFTATSTAARTPGIVGYPDTGATLNLYGAQYTGDGVSGIFLWGLQLELVPDTNIVTTGEILTNTDFSSDTVWTKGSGWTISGGTANHGSGTANSDLVQSIGLVVIGQEYIVQLTITSASTAVSCRVIMGNVGVDLPEVPGTYSVRIVPTTTGDGSLRIRAVTGTSLYSVDNVSARRITGSTGMPTPYSRNHGGLFPARLDYDPITLEDGSPVEVERTNLFRYSADFTNAVWIKDASTVIGNTAGAPDGTATADSLVEDTTTGTHSVAQNRTLSATTYTFSAYVKAAGRSWVRMFVFQSGGAANSTWFNLATGTVGTVSVGTSSYSITNAGNGWYRCTITFTALGAPSSAYIHPALSDGGGSYLGNASTSLLVWGAQLEEGTFPTSYIPTGDTTVTRSGFTTAPRKPLGFLVEEQRTNLLLRSEQFDNASWTKTRSSIVVNATRSPDGNTNAAKLVEDTSTGTHIITQSFTAVSTSQAYAFSVYAKAAERSVLFLTHANNTAVSFNLEAGTCGVGGIIQHVGNGWYRCSVTTTAPDTVSRAYVLSLAAPGTTYTGNGTSGLFIWGAQLEAGAFITNYIPTAASQVTRIRDGGLITANNFSSWYNQPEGTFVVSFVPRSTIVSGTRVFVTSTADGSSQRVIDFYSNGTSWLSFNGTANLSLGSSVVSSAPQVAALSYRASDYAGSLNGGTIGTLTTATVNSPTQLALGYLAAGSPQGFLNGYIRRVRYYPTRLTNAQLQAISTGE
jgi:hypothetical protein